MENKQLVAMRNSTQEDIVADKKSRMSRFRAEAEAASDALEEQVNPSDRTGFYLRQLETVLSHLVEIATGIGKARGRFDFAGWDLIAYADVSIARAQEGDVSHRQDEQWRRLWDLLKKGIVDLRRWAGDGETAARLAKVMFVAAFVVRRFYEAGSECGLSGEERAFEFCAGEIPFPIEVTLPLEEQVKIVAENLEWLDEQMRRDVVRPRWW